jgi:glucokinase
MTNTDLVLGIDVGGTNTAMGYVDRSGRCLAETSIPTRSEQSQETYFQRVFEAARALLETVPGEHRLVGIGFGAPNGNFYTSAIENPPNLKWDLVDVRGQMAAHWSVPVAVTNDANAAALGELMFGAGKGMRDFLVITLGTGLGSGFVANGDLLYGYTGFAGELGHTIVQRGGRRCGCGLLGCLETYASATGIQRTARELLASRPGPSPLRDLPEERITSKAIFEAAKKGDPIALEAFQFTGTILGRQLAVSVAHTGPEAIFLFGGLALAGELIFEPTRKAMEEDLCTAFRGRVKLLPSGIPLGQAAILGAAALSWNERTKAEG